MFRKLIDESNTIYTTVKECDLELDEIMQLAFMEPEVKKDVPKPRKRQRRVNPLSLKMIQDEIDEFLRQKATLKARLSEIHDSFSNSAIYSNQEALMQLKAEETKIEKEMIELKQKINNKEDEYLELACDE